MLPDDGAAPSVARREPVVVDVQVGDMKVGVVIVTHAGASDMLQRCVSSVASGGGADLIIVIDNSGGPAEAGAGTDAHGPGIDQVICVANDGFGAAANVGFQSIVDRLGLECGLALLNDDVTVEPGWLEPLVAALATDEHIGAVQPKMLLAGTEPPLVNSVGVALDAAGAGSDIGMGLPDGPEFATSSDIAIFSGGAVLFTARFIADLGGFDERYFLYYEDVDLALRGRERGWRFCNVPGSVVHHEASATTQTLGDEVLRLQERNRLWVAFRFADRRMIAKALWLSVRRLRHAPRGVHARALATGLGGAPRRLLDRGRSTGRRSPS